MEDNRFINIEDVASLYNDYFSEELDLFKAVRMLAYPVRKMGGFMKAFYFFAGKSDSKGDLTLPIKPENVLEINRKGAAGFEAFRASIPNAVPKTLKWTYFDIILERQPPGQQLQFVDSIYYKQLRHKKLQTTAYKIQDNILKDLLPNIEYDVVIESILMDVNGLPVFPENYALGLIFYFKEVALRREYLHNIGSQRFDEHKRMTIKHFKEGRLPSNFNEADLDSFLSVWYNPVRKTPNVPFQFYKDKRL